MRKSEFIESISQQTGIVQRDVDKIITAALDIIRETVSNGDKVQFNHFGVFKSKWRPEKIGRNLKGDRKNPEPVLIPAKHVAQFKPCKNFIIR
jgi:DNA-binding protein HU-beta